MALTRSVALGLATVLLVLVGAPEAQVAVSANNIAKWDGATWAPLGSGVMGDTFPTEVLALTVFDDGTGPALYAGGRFTTAGGVTVNGIARWDGTSWAPLGSGMGGILPAPSVSALTVFDDGTGPALYVGGVFTTAGGVPANFIAKWDGTNWAPLGGGTNGAVSALAVFDDGTGPALYAGGFFTVAIGGPGNGIAKWDGMNWAPLGSGVGGMGGPLPPGVFALAVFDDGTGPALYAGGAFTVAGGVAASNIAKWDGTTWTPLGSGVSDTFQPEVLALTVFDDGTGPALYAGGTFATAGGVPASNIGKWDGTTWASLSNGTGNFVLALTVFDDGTGPALYAGGFFTTAGGVPANRIAKWDGPWAAGRTAMGLRLSSSSTRAPGLPSTRGAASPPPGGRLPSRPCPLWR